MTASLKRGTKVFELFEGGAAVSIRLCDFFRLIFGSELAFLDRVEDFFGENRKG
jgi:hypothetical protein